MSIYSLITAYSAGLLHDFSAASGNRWQDQAKTVAANDGDPVGVWSPTGYGSLSLDMIRVSADSRRPTFRSNYESSGYPALEFNGTSNGMNLAITGYPAYLATKWMLAAVDLNASGFNTILGQSIGIPSQFYHASSTLVFQAGISFNAGAASALDGRFVLGFLSKPNGSGLSVISAHNQCIAGKKTAEIAGTNSGNLFIGCHINTANFWSGCIHQIMFGSGNITAMQFQNMQEQLATDWGISSNPLVSSSSKPSSPFLPQVIG